MTRAGWSDFRGQRGEKTEAPMQEGRLKTLIQEVFSDPKGEELLDLLVETYVFRSFEWGVSERALREFEGFRKCVLVLKRLSRSPNVANASSPTRRRRQSKSGAGQG